MQTRPRVLVLSGNEDLLKVLAGVLERAGFEVGTARVQELERSEVDAGALLHGFDPQAVVLELALPYPHSAQLLRELRQLPEARGRAFVLVSANARAAAPHAGAPVLELLLQPADLAELVARVQEAVRAQGDGLDAH
jgi:DNA-binding response OmpR family regulator